MVKPLKERIHATLAKHGPATTDTIAQRISVRAKLISPRLSELRAAKKVSMTKGDGGEEVWRAK
jgi:predicted ArsR family transcriptional regulator